MPPFPPAAEHPVIEAEPVMGKERGFTLLELMIVLAILGIVLAMAGGALYSLGNATVRDGARITDEQDASTALAQMARDVRSAHSITFATTTTNAADTVILEENQPCIGSSSTTTTTTACSATAPVEWTYIPPTGSAKVGTLERSVLNSSLSPVATRKMLTDVANGTVTPVFAYYNLEGTGMSTTASLADQTLETCTTSIGITLVINPSPISGVTSFTESNQVAITDQQEILSAPGNQQCGLSN